MKAIPKQLMDKAENESGQQLLEKVADDRATTGDDDFTRTLLR